MDVLQDAPTTVILAEDEASLYLQTTIQSVWAPTGQTPVVRADPGRTKTNFYGTLDLLTGQELAMRADKMNAESSAAHLTQILQAYPDRPILLFWDRAPWHQGSAVRRILVANPRLEAMSFPVAAPKLNPQEHVWKETRRAVSHNHLQARLPELADQFEQHLTTTTFESSFLNRYGYTSLRPMFT
jgi:transposase